MKIDLHCNLPYDPNLSNPALAYLKGYLSSSNYNARNIYWNILPRPLFGEYEKIRKKVTNFFQSNNDMFMCLNIARYLYHEDYNNSNSPLSCLFDSPYFMKNEFQNFIESYKQFINNEIEKKALYKSDIAGFTMSTYQWILNYYIINQLKEINPDLPIIIGGFGSQDQAKAFMQIFKMVDFAIWGEGEHSLILLIQNIDNKSYFKKIPNLIYRTNGTIKINSIPKVKTYNINDQPFADHSDYINEIHKQHKKKDNFKLTIFGTRSCSWNKCKFCILYNKESYREKSPENIVSELEFQADKYNLNTFLFVDADLGLKTKKNFNKFLELLIQSVEKRKQPYHLFCEMSPIRLDRNTIDKMNKIRFDQLQIGFESTSDSLLSKMNKKQSFSHNIQALKLAMEKDLSLITLNIIRGIPSETYEDVMESIRNLKFLRFYLCKYNLNPSELMMYKGSPFYTELTKKEIEENYTLSYIWNEIKNFNMFSSLNKYEFFGFTQQHLIQSFLWDIFSIFLRQYQSTSFNYNWYQYSDGSSLIKEGDKGYLLNSLETNILTFCDTVKSFDEIVEKFKTIKPNVLKEILSTLKSEGLLYFKDDYKSFVISVISTKNKEIF